MFLERDHFWMQQALQLACQAEANGEVPVGAVLVFNDEMIGQGFNRPIMDCDATAHAEIVALREGAQALNNYRLVNSTLYVTLEPCVMCLGAMVHARVKRLVFGASDPRSGAVGSAFTLLDSAGFNHRIEHAGGLLAEPAGRLLSDFFLARRELKAKA